MSVCLSCGHQRDSCEICGGDLEDAHVYCDALRAENEQLKEQADGALLVAQHVAELRARNAKLEKVAEAARDWRWGVRRDAYDNLCAALAELEGE